MPTGGPHQRRTADGIEHALVMFRGTRAWTKSGLAATPRRSYPANGYRPHQRSSHATSRAGWKNSEKSRRDGAIASQVPPHACGPSADSQVWNDPSPGRTARVTSSGLAFRSPKTNAPRFGKRARSQVANASNSTLGQEWTRRDPDGHPRSCANIKFRYSVDEGKEDSRQDAKPWSRTYRL